MDFTVGKAFDGLSLGDFLRRAGVGSGLLAHCKRVPRGILLNGRPVTVRARVAAGDAVFLFAEDATENGALLPADLPFEELFCRGGVRVAGKPAGMPTHPSHGHREDTLANALKYRYGREDPAFCPRFVNRLDRDTTGTVLVAFDRYAAGYLSRAMAAGEIGKRYLALTAGRVPAGGRLVSGIRRERESIIRRVAVPHPEIPFFVPASAGAGNRVPDFGHLPAGRDEKTPGFAGAEPAATALEAWPAGTESAVTDFTVLCACDTLSLLSLSPRTGRTHQLRVQLAALGYPILGDSLYGPGSPLIARQALHAASLTFPLPPDGERMTVRAPLPSDMAALVFEYFGKEGLARAES